MFSTTVRDALVAWVRAATGLGAGAVILSDQDGRVPAKPFVTVRLGSVTPLGAYDPAYSVFDPGGDPGEEIVESVRGEREFTVSLQAFVGGTPYGAADGRALLGACQTGLALPSIRSALRAAGVTIFDLGTVQVVPGIAGTEFEARATLTVRGYGFVTAESRTGYIDTVPLNAVSSGAVGFTAVSGMAVAGAASAGALSGAVAFAAVSAMAVSGSAGAAGPVAYQPNEFTVFHFPLDEADGSVASTVGGYTLAESGVSAGIPGVRGGARDLPLAARLTGSVGTRATQVADYSAGGWVRYDVFPSTGSARRFFKLGADVLELAIFRSGGTLTLRAVHNFSAIQYTPVSPPVLGQWYHIVFTRAGNTFTMYQDGAAVGFPSVQVLSPLPATAWTLDLGSALSANFDGAVDDVFFESRAMTAPEVLALYQGV